MSKPEVNDPIEQYLDHLFSLLNGQGGAAGRRLLREAEEHLREAEGEGIKTGLSAQAAAMEAIDRFGSPDRVALSAALEGGGWRTAVRESSGAAWLLGGLVLLCIGLSGLIAAGFAATVGPSFVAGDQPGVTYTVARCAEFAEYVPNSTSCAQAATEHHLQEVVGYREDAGILGVVVLLGWYVTRRARARRGRTSTRSPVLIAGSGVILLGVAAGTMLGLGALQLISGLDSGAGEYLADGLASAVGALGFVTALVLLLRRRQRSGMPSERAKVG